MIFSNYGNDWDTEQIPTKSGPPKKLLKTHPNLIQFQFLVPLIIKYFIIVDQTVITALTKILIVLNQ